MENKHVDFYSNEIDQDTKEVIDEFTDNFKELGFESFVVIGINEQDEKLACHYSGRIIQITGMIGITLGGFCNANDIPKEAVFGALKEMEAEND